MSCPKYYIGKHKGIEAMDVVFDFSEDNYNIGTALTYLMRAGKKPGNPITQDLEKAIVHLTKELKHQKAIENEKHNDLQEHLQHGRSALPKYTTSTTQDSFGKIEGVSR